MYRIPPATPLSLANELRRADAIGESYRRLVELESEAQTIMVTSPFTPEEKSPYGFVPHMLLQTPAMVRDIIGALSTEGTEQYNPDRIRLRELRQQLLRRLEAERHGSVRLLASVSIFQAMAEQGNRDGLELARELADLGILYGAGDHHELMRIRNTYTVKGPGKAIRTYRELSYGWRDEEIIEGDEAQDFYDTFADATTQADEHANEPVPNLNTMPKDILLAPTRVRQLLGSLIAAIPNDTTEQA